MHVLVVIVGAIALIVGSLVVAFLLCLGSSELFRLIRHPDWGPLAVVVGVVALLFYPTSEFVRVTAVLAVFMAIPFWIEGRSWRLNHV